MAKTPIVPERTSPPEAEAEPPAPASVAKEALVFFLAEETPPPAEEGEPLFLSFPLA